MVVDDDCREVWLVMMISSKDRCGKVWLEVMIGSKGRCK